MDAQIELNDKRASDENWWPGQVVGVAGATKNLERIALDQLRQLEQRELTERIVIGTIIGCAHSAGLALRMAIQSAGKQSHRGLIHQRQLRKAYSKLREDHGRIEQAYRVSFDRDMVAMAKTIDLRYSTKSAREREKARVTELLTNWKTARQVVAGTSKADWRFSAEEPALAITSTYGLIGLHLTEGKQMFPGLARQLSLVIAFLYKDTGSINRENQ